MQYFNLSSGRERGGGYYDDAKVPGAGRQARLPLKVAPALAAQLLLGEPESLLMLLPPPFLAVELSPNPISATFDTQQSPSLLPPLSLSLDTLIHFSDNQCP